MLYSEYYISQNTKKNIPIDKKFVKWINTVEGIVLKKIGFTLSDIPDEDYMLNYESQIKPNDMAQYIIKQYDLYSNY